MTRPEAKTPLRKLSSAQSIARTVLFLLSSSAALISGQALTVSGGLAKAVPDGGPS
ncbi:SDR family oxidoreductase [Streptomyces sp. NPDC057717]|uniref:SDR family oxidoreductase n=1 Tax=Streptomyces sp. NPDC057717 TaxID=3346224 RepID=UPI0036BB628D